MKLLYTGSSLHFKSVCTNFSIFNYFVFILNEFVQNWKSIDYSTFNLFLFFYRLNK